jgi:hypothetical protein
MYIEVVPNRNSRPAILLREGWREGPRVHKRTLANLTDWPDAKIAALRKVLNNEPLLGAADAFHIERSLPHGHVEAVLATVHRLKLPALLDTVRSRARDLVLALIVERLVHPASKLATTRLWHTSTLAEELQVGDADEDAVYAAMDWLLERQAGIEQRLAARHLVSGAQVLYDVSSSYYEGHTCPLMQFGHDRDGKRGKTIVVYGVLADVEGRPLAVQVYAGNTGDPKTVPDQVERLRTRFGLPRVVLVGDRGMLTETQIEHLRAHPGLGWISALRSDAIRALLEGEALQLSLFDAKNLAEITAPAFPGERLVACYNPLLAERRRRTREELLQTTEQGLEKIGRAVARRTKTPLTAGEIGQKVGALMQRFKVAKHFDVTIADGSLHYARRAQDIEHEAQLDGLYVIRTSEPSERLSPEDTVRSYKNLARVEQAFRCMKTVDLLVRPIRHRDSDRVKAHIFLCLLAYYVEWHMRKALAPLLFDDEEFALQRQRRDPVLPAKPSASAQRKKHRRRTADGLPVHSFETLLAELATRCRHQCRLKSDPSSPQFQQLTEPTRLQQRAMELIKMFPVAAAPTP